MCGKSNALRFYFYFLFWEPPFYFENLRGSPNSTQALWGSCQQHLAVARLWVTGGSTHKDEQLGWQRAEKSPSDTQHCRLRVATRPSPFPHLQSKWALCCCTVWRRMHLLSFKAIPWQKTQGEKRKQNEGARQGTENPRGKGKKAAEAESPPKNKRSHPVGMKMFGRRCPRWWQTATAATHRPIDHWHWTGSLWWSEAFISALASASPWSAGPSPCRFAVLNVPAKAHISWLAQHFHTQRESRTIRYLKENGIQN